MRDDLRYWIGFNIVKGIGPAKLRALLEAFGDIESAWHASPDALRAAGLDRRAVETLPAARAALNLDAELAKLQRAGVATLTWADDDYPRRLREIPNSPPVLYLRGRLTEADEFAVAVVGTRRPSAYGQQATSELVSALAASGVTVVSGLARGIDAAAHRAALEAGGRTLAVLGSGLDRVYPTEHARLAEAVAGNGAVISDYPLGTPPESGNFPPRNRIISGLAMGVLVVEAGETSGALITADVAGEQGRPVFAVPGSILSRSSRGANRLIQQGATIVTRPEDILEELNLTMAVQHTQARAALPTDETERTLLDYLSVEPTHIDELRALANLPIAHVSSALALMELKGMVRQVGGMNYVLVRER